MNVWSTSMGGLRGCTSNEWPGCSHTAPEPGSEGHDGHGCPLSIMSQVNSTAELATILVDTNAPQYTAWGISIHLISSLRQEASNPPYTISGEMVSVGLIL